MTIAPINDALKLAQALLGTSGIELISATYSGGDAASGTYANGPLGIANGIVVTSGAAAVALPPNDASGAGMNNGSGGDALCDSIAPGAMFLDAAKLTVNFKIKSGMSGIRLDYVVGSEEYPEYAKPEFDYNDVVGVFVDGKNVALDANGKPISIKGPFFTGTSVIVENGTQYDGSTPRLVAKVGLDDPTIVHTLTIVVCDAGDGNFDTGVFAAGLVGCSGDCAVSGGVTTWCGNGKTETGEACDDGNNVDTDGCTNACTVDPFYTCTNASPSVCTKKAAAVCGNSKIETGEECDDGNTADGDGCDSKCQKTSCGNGIFENAEECDDKNVLDGDGCSAKCKIEAGYACKNAPQINTGSDGVGGAANIGSTDPIWTWSETLGGTAEPATVAGNCAEGAWVDAPAGSTWINRYGCGKSTPEKTLTYYTATFNIASPEAAATTVLAGTVWADNEIKDVLVNGKSTKFTGSGFNGPASRLARGPATSTRPGQTPSPWWSTITPTLAT
ncbi:MAG: choice-of-anchor L domain-containing protein [Deltaproteobacteria bacterium]|nr:choice-of-anchor L domain-containing protein [Deltaproteobacteria bacterium]